MEFDLGRLKRCGVDVRIGPRAVIKYPELVSIGVDLVERAIAQSGMGATVARPVVKGGHLGVGQGRTKYDEQA